MVARIGAVAYKLDLPLTSKIHPVVHVSQLKKAQGAVVPVSPALPPDHSVLQAEHIPETALESKMIRVGGELALRLRIKWSDLPPFMTTWEEPQQL